MDRYRVGDRIISFDEFATKIVETLRQYRYADLDQLVFVLKARKEDINFVLKEVIVKYVKANPNITIRQVCTRLCVKSDFIEELINEGRIEFNDLNELNEIKNEQGEVQKNTQELIHNMKRRDAINALQASTRPHNHQIKEDVKIKTIHQGFHIKKDK